MGVTLNDIAKKVGVSPSTVSRVINGSAPISEGMKKKIYEAMQELNYHPNSIARTLATGNSKIIGLVMDTNDEIAYANSFFNRSVYAIEQSAQKNGYNLIITSDNGNTNSPVLDLIYGHKVDGLIVPVSGLSNSLLDVLKKEETPWIMMGESSAPKEGICWVDMDNRQGSESAVHHLLKQGYQNIVYVADNLDTVFTQKRIEGYRNALYEEHSGQKGNIINYKEDLCYLRETVSHHLSTYGTDAFICSNNVISYHILQVLKELNKNVPCDVGLVTFDNYPMAEYMNPPLTAVDINTYLLGKKATELLIWKLQNKSCVNRGNLIQTELIIRESSMKI